MTLLSAMLEVVSVPLGCGINRRITARISGCIQFTIIVIDTKGAEDFAEMVLFTPARRFQETVSLQYEVVSHEAHLHRCHSRGICG